MELNMKDAMMDFENKIQAWSLQQQEALAQTERKHGEGVVREKEELQRRRQEKAVFTSTLAATQKGVKLERAALAEAQLEVAQLENVVANDLPAEVKNVRKQACEKAATIEKNNQEARVVRQEKTKSIRDIEIGLKKFRQILGLDVITTDKHGAIRVSLRLIDPADWQRPFSVQLALDNNQYHVQDVQPSIDPEELEALVARLNSTGKVSSFLCRLRAIWKAGCAQ